jgi:hypothetical protein
VNAKALLEYGALIAMALGAVAYFETSRHAEAQYETISADQETGRLENERQLIELELKFLSDKAEPTQAEKDRIEYLKKRRELIEERLLASQKA